MFGENERERANDVLDAFVGGEQTEGQQDRLALDPKEILEVVGVHEGKVGDTVGDDVNLLKRDAVDFVQVRRGKMAHDDEAVGEVGNLVHGGALVGVRFAQDGVQGSDQRHLEFAQQAEDVAAGEAAKDAEFVLQADEVVAVEVEELGSALVGGQVVLGELQTDPLGVFIAGVGVVDGDGEETAVAELGRDGRAEIGGEGGDAALAGQVVAHERDTSGQGQRGSVGGRNRRGARSYDGGFFIRKHVRGRHDCLFHVL